MIRAIGKRYSADWYNTGLINYGRLTGRPDFGGCQSTIGLKIFAGIDHGMMFLAIDQRGPGLTRAQVRLPFSSRPERRAAFAMAKKIYDAMTSSAVCIYKKGKKA